MTKPIIQKGRDRYKMRRRKPISSCKEGKDTNGERTVQKEVLYILFTQTIEDTSTRALQTLGL